MKTCRRNNEGLTPFFVVNDRPDDLVVDLLSAIFHFFFDSLLTFPGGKLGFCILNGELSLFDLGIFRPTKVKPSGSIAQSVEDTSVGCLKIFDSEGLDVCGV